jgi:hypothetical protein
LIFRLDGGTRLDSIALSLIQYIDFSKLNSDQLSTLFYLLKRFYCRDDSKVESVADFLHRIHAEISEINDGIAAVIKAEVARLDPGPGTATADRKAVEECQRQLDRALRLVVECGADDARDLRKEFAAILARIESVSAILFDLQSTVVSNLFELQSCQRREDDFSEGVCPCLLRLSDFTPEGSDNLVYCCSESVIIETNSQTDDLPLRRMLAGESGHSWSTEVYADGFPSVTISFLEDERVVVVNYSLSSGFLSDGIVTGYLLGWVLEGFHLGNWQAIDSHPCTRILRDGKCHEFTISDFNEPLSAVRLRVAHLNSDGVNRLHLNWFELRGTVLADSETLVPYYGHGLNLAKLLVCLTQRHNPGDPPE